MYVSSGQMWDKIPGTDSKKIVKKRKDEKKPKKCDVCSFYLYSLSGIPDNTANVTSRTPFFNDTCNGSVSTGGRIADV
jgi:hypothetical protein